MVIIPCPVVILRMFHCSCILLLLIHISTVAKTTSYLLIHKIKVSSPNIFKTIINLVVFEKMAQNLQGFSSPCLRGSRDLRVTLKVARALDCCWCGCCCCWIESQVQQLFPKSLTQCFEDDRHHEAPTRQCSIIGTRCKWLGTYNHSQCVEVKKV